jgi:tetratricopeptide (TPR) repeat protein
MNVKPTRTSPQAAPRRRRPQRHPRPRPPLLLLALAGAPVVMLCWTGAAQALPSVPSVGSALAQLRPHLPAWAERWLYNPRERTAAAIAGIARHDGKAAVAAADTALRLAPGDPLASYNAGSARLAPAGAGDAGGTGGSHGARLPADGTDPALARAAVPLLEQAVRGAGRDLTVDASYNLGNARFAAGDLAGAVEAYKQTLRAAPGNADAKFNLELALRAQQRQQSSSRRAIGPRGGGGRPREGERGERAGLGGNGAAGTGPQPGRPPEQRAPSLAQDRSQGRTGQAQVAQGLHGQPSQLAGRQPLAGYQDQPEMSASEAATVLEAVQNRERQQRRQAAARLARQRAANGEDW